MDKLPNFKEIPSDVPGETVNAAHKGTIHFEEKMETLHRACEEAARGFPAKRPVIEMVCPTAVDTSLAPR